MLTPEQIKIIAEKRGDILLEEKTLSPKADALQDAWAEYDKQQAIVDKFQTEEPKNKSALGTIAKILFETGAKPFAELQIGGVKGILSTLQGLSSLMERGIKIALPEKAEEFLGLEKGRTVAEMLIPREITEPTTPIERIGKTVEQIGEFMIPVGGQIKGASWLFRSLKQGLEFAVKSAAQTGGEPMETGISGIIGAIAPPVGQALLKAAPPIGKILANGLSIMIGKEPEHIYRAFQNAPKVIEGMAKKIIPLDIANRAIGIVNNLKTRVGTEFETGLNKLQQESKTIIPYTQKTLGESVQSIVQDTIKGMPAIFRKLKVGVKKTGELLFDRSAIVKGGEQKNIQAVYDTILKQRDFSPEGMQSTAARINALSKFVEGAKEESSVIIGQIHDVYSRAIEKTYPKLSEIRNVYAVMQQQIEEIGSVLNSVRNNHLNPVQATTVAKRLSNLFKEDNEAYIRAIEKLEKLTGMDLLNDLVASEFKNILPSTFGSRIAQLGIMGGGFVTMNPFILVVLPLFSPKFIGKVVTTLGKAYPVIEKAPEKLFRGLQQIITPIQREIRNQ